MNGKGTGTYGPVTKEGDKISTIISLNLTGLEADIPASISRKTIYIYFQDPFRLYCYSSSALPFIRAIVQENGKTKGQSFDGGYYEFTKLSGPPGAGAASAALYPPGNFRAGQVGADNNVTLVWDSAGDGVTYFIYSNTSNNPESAARMIKDPWTGTSMVVGPLAKNVTWYFWVTSVKNGAESAKSAAVMVKTPQ
jgi:hypothetical protein